MWKKVKSEGSDFFVNHTVCGNLHKIHISDFINLWYENVGEDSLLMRCQEMNKLVDASEDVFLSHVSSLLDTDSDGVVWTFTETDSSKVLNLQASLDGFKFRMKFLLTPASSFEFYEEVTRPLLTVISELETRQQLLVDTVKRKDAEILEYKLEGGQISRKAVETAEFDPEVFCAADLRVAMCHPSQALTPLVQNLWAKIATAPQVTSKPTTKEKSHNKKKKTSVKSKSPLKQKKLQFYDDDDDVGDQECKEAESKSKQEIQPQKQQIKRKLRPHKVLPNL